MIGGNGKKSNARSLLHLPTRVRINSRKVARHAVQELQHKNQPSKIYPETGLSPHPDNCRHEHCDCRHSTKKMVARVWCQSCCVHTYLKIHSQTIWGNPDVSRKQFGTSEAEIPAPAAIKSQALEVAKVFRDVGEDTLTQMSIQDKDEQQNCTIRWQRVVTLVTIKFQCCTCRTRTMEIKQTSVMSVTSKFLVVDLETNPQMFVILVKGCNTTVHHSGRQPPPKHWANKMVIWDNGKCDTDLQRFWWQHQVIVLFLQEFVSPEVNIWWTRSTCRYLEDGQVRIAIIAGAGHIGNCESHSIIVGSDPCVMDALCDLAWWLEMKGLKVVYVRHLFVQANSGHFF